MEGDMEQNQDDIEQAIHELENREGVLKSQVPMIDLCFPTAKFDMILFCGRSCPSRARDAAARLDPCATSGLGSFTRQVERKSSVHLGKGGGRGIAR